MDNLTMPAILLALGGIVVAWARDLPKQLGKLLARHFLASVYVRDQELVRQIGIAALELWGIKSRWSWASLKTRRERSVISFEAARGRHLVRWQGRLVLLDRAREEGPSGASAEIQAMLSAETVTLYAARRHAEWLRELVRHASEFGQQRLSEKGLVRIADPWGQWIDLEGARPRPLSSVILPGRLAEDLLQAIQEFLSSADLYASRGTPWRLSIGIFGPPGGGKGALVKALCSEAGLTLHMPDMTGKNASDSGLLQSLARLGPRSAVLLDDMDAARMPTRETSPGGLTLAGLLGAIDGPGAGEGRVLFICSNHPEKFDPALLRGGRIDITVHLGPATRDQARRLYLLWHPGDEVGAERFGRDGAGKAMADLATQLRQGSRIVQREAVAG